MLKVTHEQELALYNGGAGFGGDLVLALLPCVPLLDRAGPRTIELTGCRSCTEAPDLTEQHNVQRFLCVCNSGPNVADVLLLPSSHACALRLLTHGSLAWSCGHSNWEGELTKVISITMACFRKPRPAVDTVGQAMEL